MKHAPGTPCWADLTTSDPKASHAFYGALFGWTWQVQGPDFGHYGNASKDGAKVAGQMGAQPGQPAGWSVYLATNNIAATVAAMTDAGASFHLGPHEVPGMGHMAMGVDPSGAPFGLWQALGHTGFDAMGSHGTPCWFEVNSREAKESRDFYASTFGMPHEQMGGMEYWTLHEGGRPRFGTLQMTERWEGIDPAWTVYFAVDDIEATAAKVKELGGTVKFGPFDTPLGRMAVVMDPQGAVFTVIVPMGTHPDAPDVLREGR